MEGNAREMMKQVEDGAMTVGEFEEMVRANKKLNLCYYFVYNAQPITCCLSHLTGIM